MVTGGGSGIGRAAALAFARAGATVMVSDMSAETGQSVAGEITAIGGTSAFQQCDVRDRGQIKALVDACVGSFGRLDHAFNNAGVGGPNMKLGDLPEDAYDDLIATNLTSIFLCMKHEIAQMLKQGGGTIVNCSSVVGLVGLRGMPVYTATKHAIMGLTKSSAIDYAQDNIRINAVCPGTIHTPAVDAFLEASPDIAKPFIESLIGQHPIGRLGTPDEIGEAVVWLSSPASSYMVGQGLTVDGGYTAQ